MVCLGIHNRKSHPFCKIQSWVLVEAEISYFALILGLGYNISHDNHFSESFYRKLSKRRSAFFFFFSGFFFSTINLDQKLNSIRVHSSGNTFRKTTCSTATAKIWKDLVIRKRINYLLWMGSSHFGYKNKFVLGLLFDGRRFYSHYKTRRHSGIQLAASLIFFLSLTPKWLSTVKE